MAMEWNGPKLVAALRVRADVAIDKVARRILDEAQRLCPVDTGALRDSGHIVPDPNGTAVYVVFDKPYAFIVEMGSSSQAPSGFLRMATMFERDAAIQTFRSVAAA